MRLRSLTFACLVLSQAASATSIWTFGPMVHFNWGSRARTVSFGVEASYWTPTGRLPNPFENEDPMVGLDLGVELEGEKLRLYSEAQYGFYLGGSAGPYMEVEPGKPMGYGIQGSLWGVGIFGADLRARYGTGGFRFSPGLMAKVGTCTSDCEDP